VAALKKIGFMKIDHIGIAVTSLADSVPLYTALVGQGPKNFEDVVSEKVKTAFFEVGESHLELLEATDATSPIAKYLAKNGRGGIHHICVTVDNIQNKLAELKVAGIQLIDETPKRGAHGKWVAFIHPKFMGGVLVELSQEDNA
jgi:methylmalonyl-CoA epimerase